MYRKSLSHLFLGLMLLSLLLSFPLGFNVSEILVHPAHKGARRRNGSIHEDGIFAVLFCLHTFQFPVSPSSRTGPKRSESSPQSQIDNAAPPRRKDNRYRCCLWPCCCCEGRPARTPSNIETMASINENDDDADDSKHSLDDLLPTRCERRFFFFFFLVGVLPEAPSS